MANQVCKPWNGQPGCGAAVEWRKVQQADGTVKNTMFNAGTNILHLPTCPARNPAARQQFQGQVQGQVQQPQVQYAQPVQQPQFQQQTINPFAPVEQPVVVPQQVQQPEPQEDSKVEELLLAINQTLLQGLLAIHKELRADNEDSMLASINNNLAVLIEVQKPAAMILDAQAEPAPPAAAAPPTPAPENQFETTKKKAK